MFLFDFFPFAIFDLFTFFLCANYIEYFRRNERQQETRKFHRYKLL